MDEPFAELIIPEVWDKWYEENCTDCLYHDLCWPDRPKDKCRR